LPDGLRFPAELGDRVSYHTESRQLRFEGFMSKSDFDKLVCLHNDVAYQRAVEHLFQICTFDDETPARSAALPMLWAGVAAAAITVGVVSFLLVR
jgi:hypothetical protein